MLTDEAFLAFAAVELGALRHRVAASPTRTAVEATIDTPSEIRALVGSTLTLVQETVWHEAGTDGSRDGDVSISVPGAPVSLSATARLVPDGAGTTITYTGELTVTVPLLGPMVEKAAAPAVLDALNAQERAAQQWLTRDLD